MAWGKTEEQKQQEEVHRQQEEEVRRQQEEVRRQREQDSRVAAEFEASPVGQALAAFTRGDAFFQAEIEVSALAGGSSFFGSSANEVRRTGATPDLLGQIEDVGWHLEHVGYVFIETGSTSTNRVLTSGLGTVTKGSVTGIYLFRRTQ
jgi:hypothetical protein